MADESSGVQLWENGPFWATCNLGAEKPYESGRYFWWGDVDGCTWEKGMVFGGDWINAKGKKHVFDDKHTPSGEARVPCPILGRVVNNILQFMAFKRIWMEDYKLTKKHDAAARLMGGAWQMPTAQHFLDLIAKCDWSWDQMEGVSGYKVAGRGQFSAASIFLPSSGWADEKKLSDVGVCGRYWSSSDTEDLDNRNSFLASLGLGRNPLAIDTSLALLFEKKANCQVRLLARECGCSIRAIRME